MSNKPNNAYSSGFGPWVIAGAAAGHPLGKPIRIRIDLQGCGGLPEFRTCSDGSTVRESYYVTFEATSYGNSPRNRISSLQAQANGRSPRSTVQWDEILYLGCFERCILEVQVFSSGGYFLSHAYRPVVDLHTGSELTLFDSNKNKTYTLCLLAFICQVSDDYGGYNMQFGSNLETGHSRIRIDLGIRPRPSVSTSAACIAKAFYTIMSQLLLLMEAVYQLKMPSDVTTVGSDARHILEFTYMAYKQSLSLQVDHPRVNLLITSMESMLNAVLPRVSAYLQQRTEYVTEIMTQLGWWASIILDLVNQKQPYRGYENPEIELARLTFLIVTPDPTFGSRNTSASSNRHAISGIIAKDTLLFVLEGIAQSSDAFPPLKSAASGLLFFATSAEMASSNKKQVRDIYKRIDGLAASLKRGATRDSMVSPALQDAIETLAGDIAALNEELGHIVAERKSRFKRFFSAKRHRAELQDVVWQLENARTNYTTALATLNVTTNAQVLAHVQALTLVMGVQPVPALGMRRADAVTFPSRTNRIEEV